jgi:hypothetical protein
MPYTIFTGLATAKSLSGPFTSVSSTPILDRKDLAGRFIRSALICTDENRKYYVACDEWRNGKPRYRLACLEKKPFSGDVVHTLRLPQLYYNLIGIGKSYIWKSPVTQKWCGLFSYRYYIGGEDRYQIRYGESEDGISWSETEQLFIPLDDWDSKMQCFPHLVRVGEKIYMFYNGDGFGEEGMGVAELEGVWLS